MLASHGRVLCTVCMPTTTLTPASVTPANEANLALALLREQAAYMGTYVPAELASFTDSTYDYVGASLDATQALLHLAYEGGVGDLAAWLFGDQPPAGLQFTLGNLGCDGLCPSLTNVGAWSR